MKKSFFAIIFTMTMLQTSAQQTLQKSGFAPVNGLSMYYEIHGSGRPLVLLHGGGSTIGTTFGRILPVLAKKYMIIAVESQAHGHTPDINRPLTFEQDADNVFALLKELEIDNADVLGFSNGGSIAMQLAIRHPERVGKLIVVSSFFKRAGIYPEVWNFIKGGSLETMPKQLKDAYLAINNDHNALKAMHDKDQQRMVDFKDWPEETIRSIKAQTLLVIGDKDVVSPEHAVEMYRLIPNCRLSIIPGGHGEFLGEITGWKEGDKMPGVFVEMVEEFLK